MKNSCRNCFYFKVNPHKKSDGWYDVRDMYSCTHHHLYNGEVSNPDDQLCEDWLDVKVKLRNDKIDKILNNV